MTALQAYFLRKNIDATKGRIDALKEAMVDVSRSAERCKAYNPESYINLMERLNMLSDEIRLFEIHLRFFKEELEEVKQTSLNYRMWTRLVEFIRKFTRSKL